MNNKSLIQLGEKCYWDEISQSVFYDNVSIKISAAQRKLLNFFAHNINKPLSSVDIYYEVWDDLEKEFNNKSIRNIISKTRKILPSVYIENLYGGYYMLKKQDYYPDNDFKDYLLQFLDQSQNAIIITDPNKQDNPIIYVNSAFTKLFEYTCEEVFGLNCRFLHKEDKEQLTIQTIKDAINKKETVTVNIRNYAKGGDLIFSEITISPIFDKKNGNLKYFLGVHKDVTFLQQIFKQFNLNKE